MKTLGVIVAGGRGTRMGPLGERLPKALLELGGRPLIAAQMEALGSAGVSEIVVLTGFLGDQLSEALPRWGPPGLPVRVIREASPLGSGGCLSGLEMAPEDRALVVLGDLAIAADLGPLLDALDESDAAILVHPNDHPWDSDLAELDPSGELLRLHLKPRPPGPPRRNRVVAGVFALSGDLVRSIPAESADLVHGVIAGALERGRPMKAVESAELVKDAGTPKRLEQLRALWARGGHQARRRGPHRRAALLDRDGTLNVHSPQDEHQGLIFRPEQLTLLPGAAEAVRSLNKAGVLAILVTNQPVVARGLCSLEELEALHARLEELLAREGAFLDGIFACPHHPDRGFPEENPVYKVTCDCRKPAPGMLLSAMERFALSPERCGMFGDSDCDMEAATRAGVEGIRVGPERPLIEAVWRWL